MELPPQQAGVERVSRAVRLFYLANSSEQNDKNREQFYIALCF